MPSDLQDWQSAQVQPAVHLATWNIPPNGTVTETLSLPAGTHGLAYASPDSSGRVSIVSVKGHTSGDFLWAVVGGGVMALIGSMAVTPFVFDPSYEPQVDVAVSNAWVATPQVVDVWAVLDVAMLLTNSADPLDVKLDSSVPLTVQSGPNPQSWEGPVSSVLVDWAAPAGGTQIEVPAVAGKVIRVFSCQFWFDAAAAVPAQLRIQDTAGASYWKWPESVQVPPWHSDLRGLPLPAGLGLRLQSDAAVAVRGSILYSQA